MHYHMEIVMPPTDDVEAAVKTILAPFDENAPDDADYSTNHAFWDWWQLGGRYSGSKIEAAVPKEKLAAFRSALADLKVTVSGLVCGKEEISPASQIPQVDAMWREMCPGGGPICPMFQHSGKQMSMDVCSLAEIPSGLMAYTLIVAGPDYRGKLAAQHMLHKTIWNGVIHQDTTFDGNVSNGIEQYVESNKTCSEDYRERNTPKPDWLVVTIDYHS